MSDFKKPRLALRLLSIGLRAFILMFARVVIMGWYIYFGLHFAESIKPGSGSGYMYLIMFSLSIFGLWQLLEFLAKVTGLVDSKSKLTESDT